MKILVFCIGKPHSHAKEWLSEYEQRLSTLTKIEWIEIKESNPEKEADELLPKLRKQNTTVVLLEIKGVQMDSVKFSSWLSKELMQKDIIFVIGGPDGFSPKIQSVANLKLSFGSLTLPHQLARLVLAEQLYRAFTIQKGIKYHR